MAGASRWLKTDTWLDAYNHVMRLSIYLPLTALILSVSPLAAQETATPAPVTAAPAKTAASPAPYLASGPRELFAKAVALAEKGAVAEAKTLFKALTLAYPELPEPHLNLAILLADEGHVEQSADAAEAAMYAHPTCRAVVDLDFQRQLSLYSSNALATPHTPASPARVAPSSESPRTAPSASTQESRVVRKEVDAS